MNAREKSCEEESIFQDSPDIPPSLPPKSNRRSPELWTTGVFVNTESLLKGFFSFSGAKRTASDIARRRHCTVLLRLSWDNFKSTLNNVNISGRHTVDIPCNRARHVLFFLSVTKDYSMRWIIEGLWIVLIFLWYFNVSYYHSLKTWHFENCLFFLKSDKKHTSLQQLQTCFVFLHYLWIR